MTPEMISTGLRGSDGRAGYPKPPSLHWALVLLFWILTGGIFGLIWVFRQAAWVRRIDPANKALLILAVTFPGLVILAILAGASGDGDSPLLLLAALGRLIFAVAFVWSYFLMRQSIEARFDLQLSGIMTFFFHVLYLQHHMTRIAKGEQAPVRHSLAL